VLTRRVAVIGGGWAGLSAAIEATLAGAKVTLFEMAPQLGGRARSVEIDGIVLDNGQHILIGAYIETLRMMRTVGVDVESALLRLPLTLVDPAGRGLRLPSGPPMLAFVRGVIGLRAWPIRDRIALLCAATSWAMRGFECDEAVTVAQLTRRLPANVRGELIDPLCVAALNTPAHSASGRVFLRVIRDALFSGKGSADLMLPRLGLNQLLPGPAQSWLAASGASVRTGCRISSIERVESAASAWRVDHEVFDGVVLACSASEAARLVQPIDDAWAAVAARLGYEPIVTVFARSAGARLPAPIVALPSNDDTQPAQFVFDHGQLGGMPGLLAFVVSGAARWVSNGADAVRDATLAQGNAQLASHLRAPLEHVRTLTEKRATFRCTPALARPPSTIAPGLMAAGDYVSGPYPATIEGAVRCAVAAARIVAQQQDR